MTKEETTTSVNGQLYDTRTGLPVTRASAPRPSRQTTPHHQSATLHTPIQKSKTLRRTPAKKPAVKGPDARSPLVARRPQRRTLDIARHPQVKKVAPAPNIVTETPDIAPRVHPHVEKANRRLTAKKTTQHPAPHKAPTAKEVKNTEIARALEKSITPQKTKKEKRVKRPLSARRKKITRLSSIGLFIAVIIGVLVWVYLPSLSVHFAASQTGVSATIPNYVPEGFHMQWPVKTKDNHVALVYGSSEANASFTLGQSNSSWNSDAVRSMVEKDSQGRFLTSRDRGITVYTYNGNAAWVNKGILYTIEGTADLSSDDIMRIANSL